MTCLIGRIFCASDLGICDRPDVYMSVTKTTPLPAVAYAIIILPGVDFFFYFLLQTLWESVGESLKLKIAVLFVNIAAVVATAAALFFSILYHPSFLFYPAVFVAVCLLGLKLAAVVIHKPTLRKLSAMASGSKGYFEACYQLLLIAITWLTGRGCYLLPMVTSTIIIGKVRAEFP